ncbi:outer membrane lipoprotein-sorting protein [Microbulbifer variabilis]|uniref:outer membrane lipoprotein-sorting protein n=1 Tax=Microbulbifer variabilis TaxID=266805 RepID=UPI001CFD8C46|nr:outer membrane lipoprotein-sorting protein [Microbulbifer variabilis]
MAVAPMALANPLNTNSGASSEINYTAQEVEDMLAKADFYRLQENSARVVTEVQVYKNGELDSMDKYHVYTRPQRKSLVVFKGAGEEGTKMLMLQDNYWMLMPRSRRPIRITPMQKLLGGASVGDVATLTWSEDYQGAYAGQEMLQDRLVNRLNLSVKTKGASYQRINLWVDSKDYFPVKAELYLKSGKLAKIAHFISGQREGRQVVAEMLLQDTINTGTETRVIYESAQAHNLPEKYYNPAYLSRQSTAEL